MGDMIDRDAVLRIIALCSAESDSPNAHYVCKEAIKRIRAAPAEDVRAGAQMADLSLPTLLKQTREDALKEAAAIAQGYHDRALEWAGSQDILDLLEDGETDSSRIAADILALIPEAKL